MEERLSPPAAVMLAKEETERIREIESLRQHAVRSQQGNSCQWVVHRMHSGEEALVDGALCFTRATKREGPLGSMPTRDAGC